MTPFFHLIKKSFQSNQKFQVQVAILFVIFIAALLPKIPVFYPPARRFFGPLGSQEVFCSLVLYSSPFIFLAYCLVTRSRSLKFSWFDGIFGLMILMNLFSFFWIRRGFAPVNPILTLVCSFFLYLLIRNLHANQLKDYTLFLLVIPVIPITLEACHGLLQAIQGKLPLLGPFYNYNVFGMLLAMSVPLVISQVFSGVRGSIYRIISLLWALFLFTIMVLTTSRTATCGVVLALGVASVVYFSPQLTGIWKRSGSAAKITVAAAFFSTIVSGLYFVYSFRPLSLWGRFLLYRVGFNIFSRNLLTGIGFGNTFSQLAKYQCDYFAMGKGSDLDRFLAGSNGMINSTYLEAAVESGILGLCLYIPFWFLILRVAFQLINSKESGAERSPEPAVNNYSLRNLGIQIWKGERNNMVRFGVGAVLILFLSMSLSYSPFMIIQINIVFSYLLGIAVSLSESQKSEHVKSD